MVSFQPFGSTSSKENDPAFDLIARLYATVAGCTQASYPSKIK
jgi:hypothetical protein